MKNNLADLNNHLFEQLERLNKDSLTPEQIKAESIRSKAMTDVSAHIVESSRLILDAQIAIGVSIKEDQVPKMIAPKTSLLPAPVC